MIIASGMFTFSYSKLLIVAEVYMVSAWVTWFKNVVTIMGCNHDVKIGLKYV